MRSKVAQATTTRRDGEKLRGGLAEKLSLLRAVLRQEAHREWHVEPRLAEALFILPVAGGLLVAATRVNGTLFRFVTAEDRLLEWSQFAGYVAGLGFALAAALALFKQDRRRVAVWYGLVALGCFFVAGEEINWGERIFGFETPESVEEVNRQGELSVHNITSIENLFRIAELLVGLAGSAGVWLLLWRRPAWLTARTRILVPPLFLTSAFFTLFAWRLFRFLIYSKDQFTIVEFTEWPELCLALGLAVFTFLVWRRLRASAA